VVFAVQFFWPGEITIRLAGTAEPVRVARPEAVDLARLKQCLYFIYSQVIV
jgi:hypothetical protein